MCDRPAFVRGFLPTNIDRNVSDIEKGARVRVPLGCSFVRDGVKFAEGMEGVVMENQEDTRNLLVVFDCNRLSSPLVVGYRYLECASDADIPSPKKVRNVPPLKPSPSDVQQRQTHEVLPPRAPPRQNCSRPTPLIQRDEDTVFKAESAEKAQPVESAQPMADEARKKTEPVDKAACDGEHESSVSQELKKMQTLLRRRDSELERLQVKHAAELEKSSNLKNTLAVLRAELQTEGGESNTMKQVVAADHEDVQQTVEDLHNEFEAAMKGSAEDQQAAKASLEPGVQSCDEDASELNRSKMQELKQEVVKSAEELAAARLQSSEAQQLKEELASLKEKLVSNGKDTLDRSTLQASEEGLKKLKEELTAEISKTEQFQEQLASLKAELATKEKDESEEAVIKLKLELAAETSKTKKFQEQLASVKAELATKDKEIKEKSGIIRRLENALEKELTDCTSFITHITHSSAGPALSQRFHMNEMNMVGMGNYGYIMTCKSKEKDEACVLKLQSTRWSALVVKEWAHGSEVGMHPNIVQYIDAFMHFDGNKSVSKRLQSGFKTGSFKGKLPNVLPDWYLCLAIEYMDRGTVEDLAEKQLLSVSAIGAIARQLASALAFMHQKKRTHNDIKPANILLRLAPGGAHLQAKLADFGLADHSSDTKRDYDLFAYLVYCMGLRKDFTKVPAESFRDGGSERAVAAIEFRDSQPTPTPASGASDAADHVELDQALWPVLTDVVAEIWSKKMFMQEVRDMEEFQNLEVLVPTSAASDLENAAKEGLRRRSAFHHQKSMSELKMTAPSDDVEPHEPRRRKSATSCEPILDDGLPRQWPQEAVLP